MNMNEFVRNFKMKSSRNKKGSALLIENGTFAWDDQEEILSSVNIRVENGELVAVVGNVGSGTTSYDLR